MHVAPTADFAVFKPERPIENVGGDVELNSDGFAVSQPAYILGYPYGLSLQPRMSTQQLPLVKGCIISGIRTDEDDVQIIYRCHSKSPYLNYSLSCSSSSVDFFMV